MHPTKHYLHSIFFLMDLNSLHTLPSNFPSPLESTVTYTHERDNETLTISVRKKLAAATTTTHIFKTFHFEWFTMNIVCVRLEKLV